MEKQDRIKKIELHNGKLLLLLDWGDIHDARFLATEHRDKFKDIDYLVLRYNFLKSIEIDDEIQSAAQQFVNRASQIKILLLFSTEYVINIKEINKGGFELPNEKYGDLLNEIRTSELKHILKSSKALFSQTPKGTYIKSPSGAIVDSFIRTGNVQSSIHIMDIFFFWLLPHFGFSDSLILDTWTISSIALNISRRKILYKPSANKNPTYVDVLSKYYGDDPSSQFELNKIINSLSNYRLKNPLFIFSASATGKSLSRLIDNVSSNRHIESARFVSIYSFLKPARSNLASLCVIDDLVNASYKKESEVSMDQVFVIDSESYMPNVLDVANEVSDVNINCELTKDSEFFSTYAGIGAVQIHRNYVDDKKHRATRHHAIYIDVLALLKHTHFLDKLHKEVLEIAKSPPKLIITPKSSACESLAIKISDMLSKLNIRAPEIYRTLKIFSDRDLKRNLQTLLVTDCVLVVDDVCITGSTLAQYHGQLRDIKYRGKTRYIVGVFRPESHKDVLEINHYREWNNDDRGYTDKVAYVEKIFLPNWGESKCPWCREQKLLTDWKLYLEGKDAIDDSVKQILSNRITLLSSSRESGLDDNCFTHPIKVTENSLWIKGGDKVSQADVIGAVASGLQRFRAVGINNNFLGGFFPKRVILSDVDLYQYNWQNTILQVSVWRMSKPHELQSIDFTKQNARITQLNQFLQNLESVDDENQHSINCKIHEVGLNIIANKIPNPAGGIIIPNKIANTHEARFLNAIVKSLDREKFSPTDSK